MQIAQGRLLGFPVRWQAAQAAGAALWILLIPVAPGGSQSADSAFKQSLPTSTNVGTQSPFDDYGDRSAAISEKQLRAMNAERQKTMVADANELLEVAEALNAEIEADNRGTLTGSQLRKVARIEKLARSVREKMLLTVGGGVPYQDPFRRPVR